MTSHMDFRALKHAYEHNEIEPQQALQQLKSLMASMTTNDDHRNYDTPFYYQLHAEICMELLFHKKSLESYQKMMSFYEKHKIKPDFDPMFSYFKFLSFNMTFIFIRKKRKKTMFKKICFHPKKKKTLYW